VTCVQRYVAAVEREPEVAIRNLQQNNKVAAAAQLKAELQAQEEELRAIRCKYDAK
jgi:hypothetical protein